MFTVFTTENKFFYEIITMRWKNASESLILWVKKNIPIDKICEQSKKLILIPVICFNSRFFKL